MSISTGNAYLDTLTKTKAVTGTASTSAKSNNTIDQSGFLKLLTKQLATQDPTAPTDNAQMVQQMATFSQVAGITEMNTALKSMATDLAAARFGDASGWIGRAALVSGDTATQATNGAYAGQITLPSDASGVTVALVNSAGQVVHSEDLGAKAAGTVDWSWDGKDASGTATSDGKLKVVVTATSPKGGAVTATNATWAEIQSVQSPASGTTKLVTAQGVLSPADVLQLS